MPAGRILPAVGTPDRPDSTGAREAQQERRADRARELMHAAEVVLLGHDDGERIQLVWRPGDYRDQPGVRSAPRPDPSGVARA